MAKVLSDKGFREGRGFSLGELKSAGISLPHARGMGIQVDARRRSTHDFNVKELLEIASKLTQRVKSSVKSRKKKTTEVREETSEPAIKEPAPAKRVKAKSPASPKKKGAAKK